MFRASVNDVGQQIAMDIDFGSAGMSGSDFEEVQSITETIDKH